MGVLVQVIATLLLCFSCVNMGISFVWPSSTILLFKSANTTLQRPMTDIEISLFSSLPAFGSMVAHPLVVGFVLDRLGRKRTVMMTSLLYVIAWSIIATTSRVEAILTAMFVAGCGYPLFLEAVIYISEFSQDSIRGTLTSCPNLSCAFGLLVSYFLGGVLEYHVMVYTCLLFSVIGVVMIEVLKESPVSLMAKGKEEMAWHGMAFLHGPVRAHRQMFVILFTIYRFVMFKEAAKSIAFYRHTSSTSKEVVTEMNNIRRSFNKQGEDVTSLVRVTEEKKSELESNKMSCWQFFKTTPSTRRQFFLVMVLKTAFVCQGLPIVQVYAEPMFKATVGDMISPNLCSVILGLVSLNAGLNAAYLTDKIGRRPLQIYSSIAAGICCAVLGTQIMADWLPKWTIPLFICFYATSHTVGSGTVTFVIASEIFLPNVKSILLVLTAEWLEICQFICLFLFNILIQSVGLSPVFYFFSFVCFASSVYFFYFLPETKGLPVYAIQQLFLKKNREILSK